MPCRRDKKMNEKHDVVVIGGGVIGTEMAYFLSEEGVDVCLVEQAGLASGTSGATASTLALYNRMPGPEWDLAMESREVYKNAKETLGHDCDFEFVSSLMLIEKEENIPWVEGRVEKQRAAGLDIEMISREELRKIDPYASLDLVGAAFCHPSAWVNSMLLCNAFAEAARRNGARIYTDARVTGLAVEGGKVKGVQTTTGNIACDIVVNAAGPQADAIGELVGCRIPIRWNRGTVVVTQPLPYMEVRLRGEGVDHARSKAKREAYFASESGEREMDPDIKYDIHFTVTQTKSGNLLIGRSGEDHPKDRTVQLGAVMAIVKTNVRFVPALAKATSIRIYAGIRPYSPDLLPLLGPLDEPKGFFLACCFGDKGVGLGAGSVKHVVRSIVDSDHRIPDALRPDRFQDRQVSLT